MAEPRRRQQRPCDACRRRRIRCLFASEAVQDCVLCISRGTSCTYIEDAPSKKRAAPRYDTTSAEQRSRPRPKTSLSIERPSSGSKVELPATSLLKETLGHQNRQSSEIIGGSGDYDHTLAVGLPWNLKGEFPAFKAPQTLRRADSESLFMVTADSAEEIDHDYADLDEIENSVSPYGPDLVSLYFRIVHPSFPILHKKVFLEKHGRSYRELTPTGLGAVYVLALNWWAYSSKLADLPKPDARKLEAKVLSMLFDVHRRPKISDLQGGLVLMQSPGASSWAMTGHLVAMAQNLGINADCHNWQVPGWERGVRKRVAWALFMQDKWGALVFGRGSHIRAEDWDVRPLTDADFPETAIDDDDEDGSAEVEQGKQTFMQMVALTLILSRILDQFFTLKAMRTKQSLHITLGQARILQDELRAWYANIPSTLSIEDTAVRKLSSVGYLHLAYHTVEVSLHRAVLRSHISFPDRSDLILMARRAAAAAFTDAHDFVKRLKGEHLQSFWYFSSSSGLVSIGLLAAILCSTAPTTAALTGDCYQSNEYSPLQDQCDKYLAQLAEYRWTLRVSARSADFIGAALSLLESRTLALEKQQQPALQSQSQAQRTGSISVNNGSALSPPTEGRPDDNNESNYTSPEDVVAASSLGSVRALQLQSQADPSAAWSPQDGENYYDFGTPYHQSLGLETGLGMGWEELVDGSPVD